MKITVIVDGQEVPCLNDVCIIYEGVTKVHDSGEGDEEIPGDLHVIANGEGLIFDFWAKESPDIVAFSAYQYVDDLLRMTH